MTLSNSLGIKTLKNIVLLSEILEGIFKKFC